MKNNYRIHIIQILVSLSIWITLVSTFWHIGFLRNLTTIELGILSFTFSGAMALFNGFATAIVKPHLGKKILLISLLLDIVLYFLLLVLNNNLLVCYGLIFLISGIFSVVSITKDKILNATSTNGTKISEIIFKFSRFSGPIIGGVTAYYFTWEAIILLNIVLLGFALALSTWIKNISYDKVLEIAEVVYIKSDRYKHNRFLLILFFVMLFVITFIIQVIDAQLVTVFREIKGVTALEFGLCIGISGIGVFVISTWFEKYLIKENYIFLGFLFIGLLMLSAGHYLSTNSDYTVLPLFIMFLVGGLCWQIIMATQENIIKSIRNPSKMEFLFMIVGIILIISYSIGALLSGYIVMYTGVSSLYLWSGITLCTTGFFGKVLAKFIGG